MFFDLPSDKTCIHPEHEPPTGLYIPPGKGYRHVCPACKTVKDVIPPQYSLAQRAQRPSMKMLTLPLKREYFEAIRDGTKTEEYRKATPYWRKRLEGRSYGRIELAMGYPAKDDQARRLARPWRGYSLKTITHPHFGPDPVEVFAIVVN